ncbi:MAG: hypothetical protein P1S46_05640 [bacterium]|nr:hypothetical protein [bacterium]
MSEMAAFMALIETASTEGILTRRRYLREHGPQEMGWSYDNILWVEKRLMRQIDRKGFFRIYLYTGNGDGEVRYRMKVTGLRTYRQPEVFSDPVDGRRYLVHSRMSIDSIEELDNVRTLSDFASVDMRKPDVRHLQLGFLFVVDPEV